MFLRGILCMLLGLTASNYNTSAQIVTLFQDPFGTHNAYPFGGTGQTSGFGLDKDGLPTVPWSAGTPWQCDAAGIESPFNDYDGDGILDDNGTLYNWGVSPNFFGNSQFLISDVEGKCCSFNTSVTSGDNKSEINFGPIDVSGHSLLFSNDFITVNFRNPATNEFEQMSGVQTGGCEPNEFDPDACRQNGSQLAVYVAFDGDEQLYKIIGGTSSCVPEAFSPCFTGISEISIRIVAGNQDDTDFYGIENIVLRGVPIIEPTAGAITTNAPFGEGVVHVCEGSDFTLLDRNEPAFHNNIYSWIYNGVEINSTTPGTSVHKITGATPADAGEYLLEVLLNGENCPVEKSVTVVIDNCYDCPTMSLNIGDACDDLNPDTAADAVQADCTCQGEDILGIRVFAKVALEGVTSNNGLMSTNLSASGLLPTTQPYSLAPFNHSGTESIASFPALIVDWVLVELRSSSNTLQVLDRKAALLRSDGILIDVDGKVGVNFSNTAAGNYFLSINHRNHLGVMSATGINFPNSSTYNFTSSASMVTGVNQMVNINGIYAMRSGDIDGTGTINFLDFLAWFGVNNLLNSYNKEDCDMTGTTNFLDFLQWFSNNNSLAVPEMQY